MVHLPLSFLDNMDFFSIDITIRLSTCHHPLTHRTGKGRGVEIRPHTAGHLLGGSIWEITKDSDSIIYAVDYNHSKERHLNRAVLETFVRWDSVG